MKAIIVAKRGEPEVLRCHDIPRPRFGNDQILVKVAAAGVNFADIMQHRGTYPLKLTPPYIPGMEIVGWVEEVGSDVDGFARGDYVGAITFSGGGYAEYISLNPKSVISIPETIDEHTAIALLIQGLSAYLLLDNTAKLQAGERVLVHAAAGGVGNLLVQIAKLMHSGSVFGSAGSIEKRHMIARWEVDHPIDYRCDNWPERILSLTNGEGVDVILDPVGGETTSQNLACLAIEGRLISYGWLSGNYPHLTEEQCQNLLFANQSICGFAVNVVIDRHPELVEHAMKQLFTWVEKGKLNPVLHDLFSLENAADAHKAILSRSTYGKVGLRVSTRTHL